MKEVYCKYLSNEQYQKYERACTERTVSFITCQPSNPWGGGVVRPPCGILPFTQTICRQPIPENSFHNFCWGYPYEIFFSLEKFCLNPLTKLRLGYEYIEESFDTIFNMGYGGGAYKVWTTTVQSSYYHLPTGIFFLFLFQFLYFGLRISSFLSFSLSLSL